MTALATKGRRSSMDHHKCSIQMYGAGIGRGYSDCCAGGRWESYEKWSSTFWQETELQVFQNWGWPQAQRCSQTCPAECMTGGCCVGCCASLQRSAVFPSQMLGAQRMRPANALMRTSLTGLRSTICAEALENKPCTKKVRARVNS